MSSKSNLYLFRSKTSAGLCGFTAEPAGDRLPQKLGPWAGIGVLRGDQAPPHGLSRSAIESGITANGYQLFRKRKSS
jgi:hypothetical protein